MARIGNTDIYPTRTIAVGGMLLGTDSTGRTVNFLTGEYLTSADMISLDTTNFDNNLDVSITDVQLLADKVDDMAISSPYVVIDGFLVLRAGKTDLNNWEDNDKFEGWVGNVWYKGRIVDASALTMPTDINDTSKVSLAHQSPAL